jgi:hypothetical protein
MAKAMKKPASKMDDDWLGESKAEPKVETKVEVREETKVEPDEMVQVLSLRQGDIVLPQGVLRFKETMKLSRESAKALAAQFHEIQII